jgi:site-specific DNA-methyltransferase (adenine-specific)
MITNAKPYFSADGFTLFHGDCLDFDIACDLIVTDPPYGQRFVGTTENWGEMAGDDDIPAIEMRLGHALKNLKGHRHIYIFGNKFDMTKLPLAGVTELIWDKGILGLGNLSLPWGPQHERITFAVYYPYKDSRKGRGELSARLRKGSVLRSQRFNGTGIKHHPTEKPIRILRQMIESSSMIGEMVYAILRQWQHIARRSH